MDELYLGVHDATVAKNKKKGSESAFADQHA